MGALNRLVAFQAVNDTSINAETAKQILGLVEEGGGHARPGDGRAPAAAKAGARDAFGEFLADVAVTVGKAGEPTAAPAGPTGRPCARSRDPTHPPPGSLP